MAEKETLLTFPCDFTIKIFGNATEEFEKTVLAIIQKHVPGFSSSRITCNLSENGKYKALSATVHVTSKNQLDDIYRDLSASPQILMTL